MCIYVYVRMYIYEYACICTVTYVEVTYPARVVAHAYGSRYLWHTRMYLCHTYLSRWPSITRIHLYMCVGGPLHDLSVILTLWYMWYTYLVYTHSHTKDMFILHSRIVSTYTLQHFYTFCLCPCPCPCVCLCLCPCHFLSVSLSRLSLCLCLSLSLPLPPSLSLSSFPSIQGKAYLCECV